MTSRSSGTLNKAVLLSVILWSAIFVTFFGVGVALAVTVNPGILFIFVVLGLSLSTVAVDSIKVKAKVREDAAPRRLSSCPGLCVAKLETHAPFYAEERITVYPPSPAARKECDPSLCAGPQITAGRSYSGSRIRSCDERIWPITHVPRRSATPLLPGPTHLESVTIRTAPPYDRNTEEETYNTSEGFATEDTTEILEEDNAVRNPPKPDKISNRAPEPKSVSWDIGATGGAAPADASTEVRSVASRTAKEGVVKPQVKPQETSVIAAKVDASDKLEIGKEDSSDVSHETEEKSSSDDTVDLQVNRNDVPSKVSLNLPGSSNADRTREGKVYRKDLNQKQVSLIDPKGDEEDAKTESEITWASLSSPTRHSGLAHNKTLGTGYQRSSPKRDQPREVSIQQELTRPFSDRSEPRRSKSAASSAGDKPHQDRRDYGSSQRASSVKDSASQTSFAVQRTGDRSEFVLPPLVKADLVEVTVINNPPSEEFSQQSSSEPTEPGIVASCSEYVQATAKMRNRAVQNEERQPVPESPKKKRLSGRLPMFLRPCRRKQASSYRVPK